MSKTKKDIEKAIKEVHEAADKAIDGLQGEVRDTRKLVAGWLGTTRAVNNAEFLVTAVGAVIVAIMMYKLGGM
jgi:hypothetical protein